MKIIAFDETGGFEKTTNRIEMIAGTIYDCAGDKSEARRERIRIATFFKKICRRVEGAVYPRDLHHDNATDNAEIVKKVKTLYSTSLSEFLTRGSFEGVPIRIDGVSRKGRYTVYSVIKSKKGKSSLLGNKTGSLTKDDYASNLYVHMVQDAVSRALFYNECVEHDETVRLDIPTRKYKGEKGEANKYRNIGYKGDVKDEVLYVELLTTGMIRASIEREMLMDAHKRVDVDVLKVHSIYYGGDTDGRQSFLYLADAICSVLAFRLSYNDKDLYTTLLKRMEDMTGKNRLLYIYDDVDNFFSNSWSLINRNELFLSIKSTYGIINGSDDPAAFYRMEWMPILEKQMVKSIQKDPDIYFDAIMAFAREVKGSNLNINELLFSFGVLENVGKNIEYTNPQQYAIMFNFYDAGVSIYNHVGDGIKAEMYKQKCNEHRKYIETERLLSLENKKIVTLLDQFDYEVAVKQAIRNGEACELAVKSREALLGKDDDNIYLAKAMSQLGQCYGYLKNNKAERCFTKALSIMDHGTPDYYITTSYLMHYYIEQKDKSQFERYAIEYFGGATSISDRMQYIADEGARGRNGLISVKYASYVFLKGLFQFDSLDITRDLLTQILDWESEISRRNPKVNDEWSGYPMPLIYKYLAMISLRCDEQIIADMYIKKLEDIKCDSDVLEVIKYYCILSIREACNDIGEKDDLCKKVIDMIRDINPGCIKETFLKGSVFNAISSIITYMYC